MFLHPNFKGVELHAAMTKQVRLNCSDEEEEDDAVLSVSKSTFLVEQMVCGVEVLDLPCLDMGKNSKITSDDMADLWSEGISVDNNNNPAPEKKSCP